MSSSKSIFSGVWDIDKYTGALIIGNDNLDSYADAYVTKVCSQALTEPMPLPVEDIINAEGLSVIQGVLSANHDIFGCCVIIDCNLDIYDHTTATYSSRSFKAGTIIVDPFLAKVYGDGFYRNTLMHEALHWYKDRKFFELRAISEIDDDLHLPIMCRQSSVFANPKGNARTKANQIGWLEWQANRLTPRILMPKSTFSIKAKEYLQECDSYSSLVKQLANFFIVSQESVRYRLSEVRFQNYLVRLNDYVDPDKQWNGAHSFAKLDAIEAYDMLSGDAVFREWVSAGGYIYVDGYFVKPDEKFVHISEGEFRLTNYAQKNLDKCALNIQACKKSAISESYRLDDSLPFALRTSPSDYERLYAFNPECQIPDAINRDDEKSIIGFLEYLEENNNKEFAVELEKTTKNPESSISDCLNLVLENRGVNYPEQFYKMTKLHKNYYGDIKNSKFKNPTPSTLFAFCVGMKLQTHQIDSILGKAGIKLNRFQEPFSTYCSIIDAGLNLSIETFNHILESKGLEPLGTKMRN